MDTEQVTIKIKYLNKEITPLTYIEGKSDWIDHVVPRSSTFKNYGLIQTNHMGVIDESYCGDEDQWYTPVLATRDTHIAFNDRLFQFRIVKHQPPVSFLEVEHLEATNRGGFGSTGKQ